MNKNLGQLTKKKQQLDKFRPLSKDIIKNLEEWLKVELTYSSNAIEGNTLSRLETAEVIEKGVSATISGKALKDQLEAINHTKALELIKNLVEQRKGHQFVKEGDIKSIHKTILTGIDDQWAGKYRQTDVFIRGVGVEFPRPNEVSYKMKQFVEWLESQQESHPVRIAADAHFKFVSIHPFVDGNGRTARLLMNFILVLNSYPMAVVRNEDRTKYLEAVNKGQTKGDLQSFYDLMELSVERSLDAYLNAVEGKLPLGPLTKGIRPSDDVLEKKLLKIGELAKATEETIHTLRYWTKQGLLEVREYTKGGYHLYSPSMINRVKKIRQLQDEERLTIIEIKRRFSNNK